MNTRYHTMMDVVFDVDVPEGEDPQSHPVFDAIWLLVADMDGASVTATTVQAIEQSG